MGFDLTSVGKRTSSNLAGQADREGYYKGVDKIYDKLKQGNKITDLIKPGDLCIMSGTPSHTAIVEKVKYDKNTGLITLEIIGYESNSTSTGVSEKTYTIQKGEGNTVLVNGVRMSMDDFGFADYLRN